ncbi:MAG: lipopolysaccharide transport periplasmic protein LptA [Xanthomonadales bacterium]|nr:lipopolysaccharide transport periplasmic protein LptA [Xanthomonadales bacterium]MCB1627942.1 lipopolysaccharide transport periplasmic protein LptA [Xanthomonadales bacterium]MCB1633922.1 lipopolysaccharide transport periplasmic protein LptA [Xanthomonadales bacterium]
MTSRWMAGLLLALLAAPAWALKSDRQQPVEVGADRSESALDGATTTLTGAVEIRQGSLLAEADKAEVTQADGAVSRVLLTGSPARLSQRLDGPGGGVMRAQARSIDYQLAADRVTLRGGVRLERPQGTLESEQVVYRVDSGQLEAGGEGGGRVRFRIEPKADAAADGAATEAGASQ